MQIFTLKNALLRNRMQPIQKIRTPCQRHFAKKQAAFATCTSQIQPSHTLRPAFRGKNDFLCVKNLQISDIFRTFASAKEISAQALHNAAGLSLCTAHTHNRKPIGRKPIFFRLGIEPILGDYKVVSW